MKKPASLVQLCGVTLGYWFSISFSGVCVGRFFHFGKWVYISTWTWIPLSSFGTIYNKRFEGGPVLLEHVN